MSHPDNKIPNLSNCMVKDRHRIRTRYRQLQRKDTGETISDLDEMIRRSQEEYSMRASSRPELVYPEELPVVKERDAILTAIRENQVLVIC
ncbi:MAG: hypothetical protein OEZ47_17475, partial [Gammaproteobacteria bacterium]|nr:hypothetical protein [Gammaproteobacteria bacterium]